MSNRFFAAAVAALAIGVLAPRAEAVIVFDAGGNGFAGATDFTITGLDWAEGSAIAVGTNGVPVVGQEFDLYYQAQLSSFSGSPGNVSYNPAAGTTIAGTTEPQEFTIVAGFREIVTNVIPIGGGRSILVFDVVPGDPLNYLQIYAHAAGTSDERAGTGFGADDPGATLILDADVLADNYTSSFTVTSATGPFTSGGVSGFDSGITSVQGGGQTTLRAEVNTFDPDYFDFGTTGPAIINLLFGTTQDLPFFAVPPALAFYDGAGGTFLRSIGTYNGGGEDIEFQADASNSFEVAAVPEPGTISVALCGIGLVSLGALRKRLRRDA